MARVLKGSHSFTCTPRVHPLTEWTVPAFAFPAEAGTHLPTPEGWKTELALEEEKTKLMSFQIRKHCKPHSQHDTTNRTRNESSRSWLSAERHTHAEWGGWSGKLVGFGWLRGINIDSPAVGGSRDPRVTRCRARASYSHLATRTQTSPRDPKPLPFNLSTHNYRVCWRAAGDGWLPRHLLRRQMLHVQLIDERRQKIRQISGN